MSSPGIKILVIFLAYLYAIPALLQKPCCDLPLVHFDHALVFQLPDLPEHEDLPKNDEINGQLEINLDDGEIIENQMITGEPVKVTEE